MNVKKISGVLLLGPAGFMLRLFIVGIFAFVMNYFLFFDDFRFFGIVLIIYFVVSLSGIELRVLRKFFDKR